MKTGKPKKRKRFKTEFAREAAWKAKHKKPPISSSLETRVELYLKEHNIQYQTQYLIERRFYDFYLPEYNLLLEIHGDYWHAFDYHSGNKTWLELYAPQKRSVRVDAKKIYIARRKGFALHVVWEHELSEKLESGKLLYEIKQGPYIHPQRQPPPR